MTAYVPPRRVTSTATTITVTSTALGAAAASASVGFAAFNGTGLTTRAAHPVSGILCDVTEDGRLASHPFVDWTGKGVYDSTNKRVQFMGAGTGNTTSLWPYNTLSIYKEGANGDTEGWTATRGWRTPAMSSIATAYGIGHTYDSNCINITGRRHYKKQFYNASGSSIGPFHVYNLDTGAWENEIAAPTGDTSSLSVGPADFIPTRGTAGRLWYANGMNGDGRPRIVEYDITTGTGLASDWTTVCGQGTFPLLSLNLNGMGIMSYNPRAFGGAGGVLLAGGTDRAYMVRADTGAATAVDASPFGILGLSSGSGRMCRHPTGTGWLMFATDGKVYNLDGVAGSAWAETTGAVPATQSFIVVPIDAYGVVWLIQWNGPAWLYKPQ